MKLFLGSKMEGVLELHLEVFDTVELDSVVFGPN